MNANPRQKILTIALVAIVAIWLGDKLVVSPLIQNWKARSGRIAELRRSVSQGRLLLERERSIRGHWDGMRTNTLPRETSVAESQVLKALERWSKESQLKLSIKPQWKQVSEDYMTLECRADASGTIQALTQFLYNVEKDPLALKVDAVEITARDNDGQQLSLALQVSGLLLNPREQP